MTYEERGGIKRGVNAHILPYEGGIKEPGEVIGTETVWDWFV